jgi:hypothetical protein
MKIEFGAVSKTLKSVVLAQARSCVRRGMLAAICTMPLVANAVTECTLTPSAYYVGDSILWIVFQEGPQSMIAQANADFKPVLATTIAAITAQKQMTVRYAADNVSCTASAVQEIRGVWLRR